MPKYLVKQGLEYLNRRVEAGDVVDDIPAKSISWLKEQGIIELVDGSTKAKVEVKSQPAPVVKEAAPIVADAIDSEDK
jgi:hypothetical protein